MEDSQGNIFEQGFYFLDDDLRYVSVIKVNDRENRYFCDDESDGGEGLQIIMYSGEESDSRVLASRLRKASTEELMEGLKQFKSEFVDLLFSWDGNKE